MNGSSGVVPGQLVNFGQSGCRWVRSRKQPNNSAGKAQDRSPDRAVHGTYGDSVERGSEALVLGGIDGLIWLHIFIALAISVGVEDESRPALRFLFIVGGIKHFRVEPAHSSATPAAAGPQGIVGVLRKHQVMRATTSVY